MLPLQLFQDRLEAVEVMLLQKPIVSGRYTGYAYRHFVLPLDGHFRTSLQRYVLARHVAAKDLLAWRLLHHECLPRHCVLLCQELPLHCAAR